MCRSYGEKTWKHVFLKNCQKDIVEEDYRGGFSGFVFNKKIGEITCFVDQMGIRPAFYYCSNDKIIFASNINYIVEILNAEKQQIELDEDAVKSMLTFGSMIDDSTLVKEIKRVLPGYMVSYRAGEIS